MQDGRLLVVKMLHDSPVVRLNVLANASHHRTACRPIGSQPEAISVLYHGVLALIEAESLAVAIRGCFVQLQRTAQDSSSTGSSSGADRKSVV